MEHPEIYLFCSFKLRENLLGVSNFIILYLLLLFIIILLYETWWTAVSIRKKNCYHFSCFLWASSLNLMIDTLKYLRVKFMIFKYLHHLVYPLFSMRKFGVKKFHFYMFGRINAGVEKKTHKKLEKWPQFSFECWQQLFRNNMNKS